MPEGKKLIKIFITFIKPTWGLDWPYLSDIWIQSTPWKAASFKPHFNTILSSMHCLLDQTLSFTFFGLKFCFLLSSSRCVLHAPLMTSRIDHPPKQQSAKRKKIKFLTMQLFTPPPLSLSLSLICIPLWSNIQFKFSLYRPTNAQHIYVNLRYAKYC
jgi:hypothetical protein